MTVNGMGSYVSTDGHVVEPADLWTTRMDKRFRDRAPRVEPRPDADYYIIDGLSPFPVGLEGATMEDKIAGEITSVVGRRHGETRPGAWDPRARLVDQDMNHLKAEVIYPGLFDLQLWTTPDVACQRKCWRVYNDGLSEFCAAAPGRPIGAGFLPMKGPIEWAVEEAQRIAKKPGLSPISIHSGASTGEPFAARFERMGMGIIDTKISLPMRALGDVIWSAVPQRFPKLKFMIVEGGIGWIASVLRLMDHWWIDHHRWMEPNLDEAPCTYFKRQFWATFEDDRAGILTRELLGVDRPMWGSDYPHTAGTFPHSQEQITRDFMGAPESEVYQMVVGNAASLYGLDV